MKSPTSDGRVTHNPPSHACAQGIGLPGTQFICWRNCYPQGLFHFESHKKRPQTLESVLEAREKRIHKHKHGPPSAACRSFPFVVFELALSTWTKETILRKTSDHLDLQDPDALNPL